MPTYDQALMSPGMANYAGLRSSGKRRQTKPRAPATAPAMPTFGDLRAAYRPYLDRLSRRMGRMAMPDLRELGAAYGPYLQPKTPPHGQQPFGYLGSAAAQPDPITAQPYGALPGKAPRLPAVPDYMQPPLATATAPLGITDAARAATSAQDLAGPSMFTPADMPASMPENIPQRRSAMQDWMGQRNRLQAFLAAGGSQGIPEGAGGMYGTPTHGGRGYATGDPRLGRTMPAAFSTYEGGFGAEKAWQPQVGPVETALTPETAAVIGPETRREMAYAPEALADLEKRAAESRARTGVRGIAEVFPEGRPPTTEFSFTRGAAQTRTGSRARRATALKGGGRMAAAIRGGKAKGATVKQSRALELEKRKIRLAGKRSGAPVPEWLAKIQAKNALGVALTPTDEKALEVRREQQALKGLSPEARGKVVAARMEQKGLEKMTADERAFRATPKGRRQAREDMRAKQGLPPEPMATPESPVGKLPPELRPFVEQYANDPAALREMFDRYGNFETLEDLDRAVESITGKTGRPEPGWIKKYLGPLVAPQPLSSKEPHSIFKRPSYGAFGGGM